MGRSPCCDKTQVKKGPWSVEEDRVLEDFITRYGNGGNWITLPKKIGLNRCGKSCRLRWINYLRPNIKRGDFSEEENQIIYTLYNIVGSRWSIIASKLPGRTDNDVKNYWNTKLKKKISSGKFINLLSTNSSGITNSNYNSNYNNNNSILQYEPTNNNNYSKSNNIISSSMMSQGEVSSQFSRTTSSSNNDIIRSNNEQENEFWMDLFSESFDDVIVSSRLVEEKVTEIASLLDVFVD